MLNEGCQVDAAIRDLLLSMLEEISPTHDQPHDEDRLVRSSWQLFGISRILVRLGDTAAMPLARVDAVIHALGSPEARVDLKSLLGELREVIER
jgi:hypothetical protein